MSKSWRLVKATAKECRNLCISKTHGDSARDFNLGAIMPVANAILGLCVYHDLFNAILLTFARCTKHFVVILYMSHGTFQKAPS